jgi:hypothetical protein
MSHSCGHLASETAPAFPKPPADGCGVVILTDVRRGSWATQAAWEHVRTFARHDVVKVRTLVAAGVPESTVYDRCRPGGPWQLLLPATVMLNNGAPSRDQLVLAGLLYAGPNSVVTGIEAVRRHGARRGPEPGELVHLLVPHTRQPASARYVVVERTWRMPEAVRRGGIPLAPVARAAIDGARRLASPREATELLADVVQRGLCAVADLSSELEAAQRRGTAIPRAVLRDVGAGVRSIAERDARALWRRSGLPEPWWNAAIYTADGELLGIADAWWDEVALAWEINSFTWHLDPSNYAREQAKTASFAAAGIPVLPTLARRLAEDATAVLRELRAAHWHAAGRPRPPVRAVRRPGMPAAM